MIYFVVGQALPCVRILLLHPVTQTENLYYSGVPQALAVSLKTLLHLPPQHSSSVATQPQFGSLPYLLSSSRFSVSALYLYFVVLRISQLTCQLPYPERYTGVLCTFCFSLFGNTRTYCFSQATALEG